MTVIARKVIARLRRQRRTQVVQPDEALVRGLLQEGLSPVEVGWVLHVVFDCSMNKMVHVATVLYTHD